jgi:hypothetical protein
MYLVEREDGRIKVMPGRRPGSGVINACARTEFKRCGWFWRKWAVYETDPDSIEPYAGGGMGQLARITPRFKTKKECVDWLERPVEADGDTVVGGLF